MNTTEKIKSLNKILEKSKEVTVRSSSDPIFKSWKNLVQRTLIKIFGDNSNELKSFEKLIFFYKAVMFGGVDYSRQHRQIFDRDMETAINYIKSYIEEFEEEEKLEKEEESNEDSQIKKVFISHANKDAKFVEELKNILEDFGLKSENIFCTSFEGYGIKFGEDFLERIKKEINKSTLVIFVLSENFYKSPVCLCEMGAAWIKSNIHIPVLIPPFDFKDIGGVIPLTQGFKINEKAKLNSFKGRIEELFNIKNGIDVNTWERKRDRAVERINKLIELNNSKGEIDNDTKS